MKKKGMLVIDDVQRCVQAAYGQITQLQGFVVCHCASAGSHMLRRAPHDGHIGERSGDGDVTPVMVPAYKLVVVLCCTPLHTCGRGW